MILDKIAQAKRIQINRMMERYSVDNMKKQLGTHCNKPCNDFASALKRKNEVAVIAEVKKASPSKGVICEDFDHMKIASEYCENGAAAISVLTETDFFLGKDEYLTEIKNVTDIPVLRKDFIIDKWQIYQSRLIGADAILLIAGLLNTQELRDFRLLAEELGMQCLVEIHNESEAESAIASGAKIIGINNRDLQTFKTDLETTAKLAPLLPAGVIKVSESGIKDFNDIQRVKQFGIDAVLVGETLMKSQSPGKALKMLGGSNG